MEKAGYRVREDRVVGGKVGKYDAITDGGRRALGETREKIAELVREVVEGEGPRRLAGPDDPQDGT
jgi:DNA-binding PadR family transcriptional regulator